MISSIYKFSINMYYKNNKTQKAVGLVIGSMLYIFVLAFLYTGTFIYKLKGGQL